MESLEKDIRSLVKKASKNVGLGSVSRVLVLERIFNNLCGVTQFDPNSLCSLKDVSKYWHRAEALMELLETEDCGQAGGYDDEQTDTTPWGRFDWLVRKYHDPYLDGFEWSESDYRDLEREFKG